jgi:hypothetical protein
MHGRLELMLVLVLVLVLVPMGALWATEPATKGTWAERRGAGTVRSV